MGRQQRQNSTSGAMLRPTWDSAITVTFVGNISRPQILFKCIFLSPIEQNLRLYKNRFKINLRLCETTFLLFSADFENQILNQFAQTDEGCFQCLKCGKIATRRQDIMNHVETHLGFTHECLHCGKHFKTRNSLKVHTSNTHKQRF